MRFAQADGTLIDVYQATTQMTDESDQTYPFTIDTLLDRALGPEGYYGVFTVNAHNDSATNPVADAVIASAVARGIPVISAKQLLTWLDGRSGSSFSALTWTGTTLSFTVNVAPGATGLQAMVPIMPGQTITSLTRGGSPAPYVVGTVKGMPYAFVPAVAGTYQVTFSHRHHRAHGEHREPDPRGHRGGDHHGGHDHLQRGRGPGDRHDEHARTPDPDEHPRPGHRELQRRHDHGHPDAE